MYVARKAAENHKSKIQTDNNVSSRAYFLTAPSKSSISPYTISKVKLHRFHTKDTTHTALPPALPHKIADLFPSGLHQGAGKFSLGRDNVQTY
jgi:hypothetical protein